MKEKKTKKQAIVKKSETGGNVIKNPAEGSSMLQNKD